MLNTSRNAHARAHAHTHAVHGSKAKNPALSRLRCKKKNEPSLGLIFQFFLVDVAVISVVIYIGSGAATSFLLSPTEGTDILAVLKSMMLCNLWVPLLVGNLSN